MPNQKKNSKTAKALHAKIFAHNPFWAVQEAANEALEDNDIPTLLSLLEGEEENTNKEQLRQQEPFKTSYEFLVTPRYLIHDSWKQVSLQQLPESLQKLYMKEGIQHRMKANILDALSRFLDSTQVKIMHISDANEATVRVTLRKSDFQDMASDKRSLHKLGYRKNVDDLQKLYLLHLLEQKVDLGSDSSQWAYGVSLGGEVGKSTMVFHVKSSHKIK